MTFAVIPAAGKSTRMGRPKLTLPVGGRTVLELVVAALKQAGVEHVLVVVAPHVPEVAALAESCGAEVLRLAEETPDMRTTVQLGLDYLEQQYHPQAEDSWLLVPADHPTLRAAVISELLIARQANRDRSIFIPTYQGRRGHPALIGWGHVAGVRQFPANLGLNVYLRHQTVETVEQPVPYADVLLDLDTPADYERLLAFVEHGCAKHR